MTKKKEQSVFDCPACEKKTHFITKIKVSTYTEPGQINPEAFHDGHRLSQRFQCPSCGGILQMHYQLKVVRVVHLEGIPRQEPAPDVPVLAAKPVNFFSPEEVQLVELCRGNGILGVFTEVVKEREALCGQPPPKFMDRHFLNFLRTVQRVFLPREALDEFAREFPGRIEFWKAQAIGMVVSDGRICRFVPMHSMHMGEAKQPLQVHGVSFSREKEHFEYLKRTTFGYVPMSARIFLQSLQHSMGDRGREMKSVPLPVSADKN